ncbi:DUF393 domain-containing protein [Marinobacter halodurans]|uniref:DUF393 domain-containing protein n=1 Tax=Marinobacter halodurans TaxID=2528979 RepID=A0ABY1ZH15_9GAMM|nr:DUF393 domain-containing protein [Marinobacter halodurans]TBW51250.1 DUF393 domain-containing protein [Marinobacter halodurans]
MTDCNDTLTVYYDGACPRCRADRRRYERWAGETADRVVWYDITGRESELRSLGIDPDTALRELHVRDPNGRIHRELEAYRLLMARVPRLKPLAWLMGLPLVRPLLSWLYRRWVLRRLHRQGRL